MNILIPIVSRTEFFPKEDYYFPKPLTEVNGNPMIQEVLKPLVELFEKAKFFFIVDSPDVTDFSLDKVIELTAPPDSVIIERRGETSGALSSCMLAIDLIDEDEGLLILNGDQVITHDLRKPINAFLQQEAAAGVVTFRSLHPRWSYVLTDERDCVTQAAEKDVISDKAVAGFYWFEKARYFFDAAKRSLVIGKNVNSSFYISETLNHMILEGLSVGTYSVSKESFHSFFNPTKIPAYEAYSRSYKKAQDAVASPRPIVVVPAAGEGSRFKKDGWLKPKPFIDIAGRAMIEHVLDNVAPNGYEQLVVLRAEHVEAERNLCQDFEATGRRIWTIDKLSEGTACTVLQVRDQCDPEAPLLIANSDQIVDFDVNDFVRDILERDLDGGILTFKDPNKDPKWSFVKLNDEGLVVNVAEKQPISDIATVGLYFFRRAKDFFEAALDMMLAQDRVNGEYYTCPVYNYLIARGGSIGIYNVHQDHMHGVGTPSDLNKYLVHAGYSPSESQPSATCE